MEVESNRNIQLEPEWKQVLSEIINTEEFEQLRQQLYTEKKAGKLFFPPGKDIFRAYQVTPFSQVKVVILGQDPYHGPGQAHGLSFSVPAGVKPPPSLVNIYKELESDVNFRRPTHGNLEKWARQGVFLLNAMLTVRANEPASHQNIGWQFFTDATIRLLSEKREHLVFILWGAFAQKKSSLINAQKHLVLKAPHPSPFSANNGFFGCKHFSQTNVYLVQHGKEPIDWQN